MMNVATMVDVRDVLAGMMVENTGRHMLDSGGAYGREWERNQGMTRADFDARPSAYWDWNGYPTLDMYHYLAERLEYVPVLDRFLGVFSESDGRERDPWLVIMEEFAEYVGGENIRTGNSYNDETFLSGVFQWVEFDFDDQRFVLLQVHGGCDVRGGYTRPRVFTTSENWYWQVQDVEIYCTGERGDGDPHRWSIMGVRDVVDWSGGFTDVLDSVFGADEGDRVCPVCGAGLSVDPPWFDGSW